LVLWGLFTAGMFVGSLRYPRAKQIVFGSLTILFFLLAARDFTGSELIGKIAGFEGIFCGASAVYFAMAQVLNNEYGRVILPIGEKKKAVPAAQEIAA
ncbi:MAG: acetate uptake transporter, partial [Vibrio fluvialis]